VVLACDTQTDNVYIAATSCSVVYCATVYNAADRWAERWPATGTWLRTMSLLTSSTDATTRSDCLTLTRSLYDLDKVTGVISTREVLDRERQSVYNLVVIARSNSRPALSSSTHVQIEVNNYYYLARNYYSVVVLVQRQKLLGDSRIEFMGKSGRRVVQLASWCNG